MKFSICIPAYDKDGEGATCLDYCLEKISEQTFTDFEVIIGDHSAEDNLSICEVANEWVLRGMDIGWYENKEKKGNPASNANFTMKKANGEWIKFLCQDDYLYDSGALARIDDVLGEEKWLATAYVHTKDRKNFYYYHSPQMNPQIFYINTIGTPSCVVVKNESDLPEMDENLGYAYDCEWYYQLYLKYGAPKLTHTISVVNYIWDKSITASVTDELIAKENEYIFRKYGLI